MNKPLRILGIFLAILLVLVAGLAAAFTLTAPGKARLAQFVSSTLSSPDSKVTIKGIDGIWGGHLSVSDLVVSDRSGPWLGLRGVAIDWSPFALFSGRFEASLVHADRIEIARAPQQGDAAAGGSPALPLAIDIARLDLPVVALGEQIAGGPATLSATGSVAAGGSPLRIGTDINVTRADGRPGQLLAKITFQPGTEQLDLSVDMNEPAGGLLAHLLQLPGLPAVAIKAKGGGPLGDWAGNGSLSLDSKVVTTLAATRKSGPDGDRITATGDGDFAHFLPEGLRDLARGSTRFDFAATLLPEGGLNLDRFDLQSQSIDASGKGTWNPQGRSELTTDVNARGDALPLALGDATLALRSASIRISGDGDKPALSARASLGNLAIRGLALTGIDATLNSAGFDLRNLTGPLSLTATATSGASDNADIAPLLAGPVRASADLTVSPERIEVANLTLNGGAGTAKASGELARDLSTFSLKADADLNSTALPAALRAPLAARTGISATIARNASGRLEFTDLAISSGALQIAGQGSVEKDAIDARLNGNIGDLAQMEPAATGAAQFSATLTGDLGAPRFTFELGSRSIRAAGQEITDLLLKGKGTADPAAPSADVDLSGRVGEQALSGSARLMTADGQRRVDNFRLTLADNAVTGNLLLDDAFVPAGKVTVHLPDIAPLAALALQQASGNLDGTLDFTREAGGPAVSVSLQGSLAQGDIQVGGVRVEGSARNYLSAPVISGTVSAADLTSGTTRIDNLTAKLTAQGDATGFDVAARYQGMPLHAAGAARFDQSGIGLALQDANATFKDLKATLAAPTEIRIKDNTVQLDGATLDLGGGSATVTGTAGQSLDLSATLAGIDARALGAVAPDLGAQGTISGRIAVTGTAAAPEATYDLAWKNAAVSQSRDAGLSALDIAASGRYSGGSVDVTSKGSGADGLGFTASGRVGVSAPQALSIKVDGTAPFSLLAARLAAQGMALNGDAGLNLTIGGTASAPDITGTITTKGSRFVDASAGIAITDLAGEIAMSGQVATISTLTGQLSSGGTVNGSGTIGISPGGDFPPDLAIRIANGRYTDGTTVTANLDADLKITGPLIATPTIGGRIGLGRTVITVPDRLPPSLANLDVKHRNASAAVNEQAAQLAPSAGDGSSSNVRLDLTLDAPRQIFVQGRGLDAELGGSLRLTGTASAPVAVGAFTLQRGRLDILNRRLTFTSGTVGFTGSLIPDLDMTAQTTTSTTTVTVRVTGPATSPEFSFSSDPTLPEDEVLAQLVFGQSLSSLSPLQIAQLAGAAAQLAGVGGSTSLLQQLQNQIGVDNLDIVTDPTTGDTSVSVGKYLNDNTYVGVQKDTTTGDTKATIDLNIGKGLKLRGEASDSGETKGGVFYELEY
ncbi:MAG TPA: translocation/assembly module TamB domain-containing protein [Devosiaceae bacterium]